MPQVAIKLKYDKYKKRLLQSCIHHFISDLINNMEISYSYILTPPQPNGNERYEQPLAELTVQVWTQI